ncbi:hypothetical protein AN639_05010 [Candidatus Epulonipiscium fishelsonii]|nr:hypothetical protein AN639_05010 [Epulopiscium sp. SCG-B05WGA-EpuloA1]ONI46926.1 hypothetical protein AN644_00270 [Epulopiscium sp. SCG-C06WGA-EpuloA1]
MFIMYNKVIIINSMSLGSGDIGVGSSLLGTCLTKMLANLNKPDAIIFYNSGTKLLVRGSYYVDILQALEKQGVDLIACGTCVYKVCGQKALLAGRISNMDEITDIILNANSVITL